MKIGILFLALLAAISCANSLSEMIDKKEHLKSEQADQQVDGTLIADVREDVLKKILISNIVTKRFTVEKKERKHRKYKRLFYKIWTYC